MKADAKSSVSLVPSLSLTLSVSLQDGGPPPSLAAFSPSDPSVVVYTGYGVEKELSFYSLVKKQVPQSHPYSTFDQN